MMLSCTYDILNVNHAMLTIQSDHTARIEPSGYSFQLSYFDWFLSLALIIYKVLFSMLKNNIREAMR